MGTIPLYI